jgi:hypothetical protein
MKRAAVTALVAVLLFPSLAFAQTPDPKDQLIALLLEQVKELQARLHSLEKEEQTPEVQKPAKVEEASAMDIGTAKKKYQEFVKKYRGKNKKCRDEVILTSSGAVPTCADREAQINYFMSFFQPI